MSQTDRSDPVRVLIVEDELLVARNLAARLERTGYEVIGIAVSGPEAIQMARRSAPNLVLMDIHLLNDQNDPMDGIQAAERILAEMDVPILYLTAHTDRPVLERARQTAPYGYLIKPFRDRELFSNIEMALFKHHIEQQLRQSEAELSAMFDGTQTLMILVDRERRVRRTNRAVQEIGRQAAAETTGQRGGDVLGCLNALDDPRGCGFGPSCRQCQIRLCVLDTLETGRSHRHVQVSLPMEMNGYREDRLMLLSTTLLEHDRDPLVLVCLEDVTPLKRTQALLEWQVSLNTALAEMAHRLLDTELSMHEMATIAIEYARRLTGSEHGFVLSIDPRGGDGAGSVLSIIMPDPCQVQSADRHVVLRPDAQGQYPGLWGHALNTGQAFYTNAPNEHPAACGTPAGHVPLQNMLAALAVVQGRPVGEIVVANRPGGYSDRELQAVQRIADLYATALMRRQAEESLRHSLQTAADIVQAIPSGLFIYQFEPPDRLILIESNPEAERLTGISAREWGGREFDEIWPQARQTGITAAYLNVVYTGQTFETEDLFYQDERISGAWRIRVFNMPGQRLGVAFEDVTARKQAEEALAGERQLLRTVIDHLPDAVYAKDVHGRKTLANRADLDNIGLSEEQVLGKTDAEMFPPEIATYFEADDQRVISTGQPIMNREEFLVNRDDRQLWQLTSKLPLKNAAGQIIGLVGIGRNVTAQRQVEQTLRQSETRYRTLFEAMQEAFALHEIIIDEQGVPCDYRFLQVNPAFEKLTGLRAAEVVGRTVLEVMPQTEPYWIETYSRVALTGEPAEFENFSAVLQKYYQVIAFSPMAGQFATIFVDATERRQAELALRESEERYRMIFQDSPLGIFRSTFQGRFITVNPALAAMLGYGSPEEVLREIQDIDRQIYIRRHVRQDIVARQLNSPGVTRHVNHYRRKDGSEFVANLYLKTALDAQGRPVCLEGIVEDITERIKAEEALRQSEATLNEAQEIADVGSYIWDLRTDALEWSRHMFVIAGLDLETFDGNLQDTIAHLIHPDDVASVQEQIAAMTAQGRTWPMEFRLVRPNGEIRWLRSRSRFELDDDGRPIRAIGVHYDVTERQKLEAERESSLELLHIINEQEHLRELICEATAWFQRLTGVEAVGVRLRQGEDFPYYETRGFPPEFVQAESRLCALDQRGELVRDSRGDPVIECMCGNVICGRFNPALPFFTPHGSFWTNSTTRLLASTSEADRQARTRNRCNGQGYESVALIPLRTAAVTLGLLQFNDRRPGRFDLEQIALLERLADHLAVAVAHQHAQEQLQASEVRYRELFDQISSGVAVYRAVQHGQDFVFVEFNRGAEQIEQIVRENVVGKRVTQVFPGVEKFGLLDVFREVWRTGQPAHHPISLYQDDRLSSWRENYVYKLPSDEIVAVYRDVTERKRAEQEREQMLAQMQRLIETVPEGVALLDWRGRVLMVNPAAQCDLWLLAHVGVGDVIDQLADYPLATVLSWSGERAWHEIKVEQRVFEIIAAPVSAERETNHSTLWVLVIRDMTRDRQTQQYMRHQDRMAAIGQLAGGVAHDFNNILTAIKGYADFAFEELLPGDPVRSDIQEIKRAADRAAALTRQMLIFSRKQVIYPTTLSLNTIIANMDKMLRRIIGEDVEMILDLHPALNFAKADTGQIEQVIMNLCVNARDAMSHGGQLTLRTDNVTLTADDLRRDPDVTPGSFVMLSVRDTGIGMSNEVQAHLFEPFFTTKEQGRGTGLGLSTVWGIVKRSLGHIRVDSQPGQGTTFYVYLPAIEMVEQVEETFDSDGEMLRGSETILLVEDEDPVRELTRRTLERQGYTVLASRSPWQAINLMQNYTGPVALLVADVIMPEMDGHEMAIHLLKLRPDLRVLYISGYTDDAISQHGVLDPGIELLSKPFDPMELARRVRRLLDKEVGA